MDLLSHPQSAFTQQCWSQENDNSEDRLNTISLHPFSTICLPGPRVINGTDIPVQLTEQDQQPDNKGAADSGRHSPRDSR